ncbi:hypothetical protein LshimejAT787_0906090 [Lyophyllum shimeji]|uniref:Uncharacterized protein n=1 Tax=Lyophyllum shimeji TaxID=47721 RepID=A0A9P3UNA3_LYOSH|nr:hypothetical protein LshimejAT787_0906090 [Lyophyllum shimeji]
MRSSIVLSAIAIFAGVVAGANGSPADRARSLSPETRRHVVRDLLDELDLIPRSHFVQCDNVSTGHFNLQMECAGLFVCQGTTKPKLVWRRPGDEKQPKAKRCKASCRCATW